MKCIRILLLGVLGMLTVYLTGCTTMHREFPDQDPDQVWTALITVANSPDYSTGEPSDRWFIKANNVWVDEEGSRIEIHRELQRILHLERTRPRREERTWDFQIRFEPSDPPRATFLSRGLAVPMEAHAEAGRYFDDVWEILSGMRPAELPDGAPPSESAPEPQPEVEPAAQPEVDIDELEPSRP